MSRSSLILLLSCTILGAGCTTPAISPHLAQPLDLNQSGSIPTKNGFGPIKTAKQPASTARIFLSQPLPTPPLNASILRYRPGTPTEVQLRNVVSALNLPAAILGKSSDSSDAYFAWTDEQGRYWSYDGIIRKIFFANAKKEKLANQLLPNDDASIEASNTFLLLKQLPFRQYRFPYVIHDSPDRVRIRYNLMIDNQDIVDQYAEPLTGIEVTLNPQTSEIITGFILLPPDVDRSDYPALTSEDIQRFIDTGGLAGTSGTITLSKFDTAYFVQSPFLIFAYRASGERLLPNGKTEPFSLIIPLLKPNTP